MEEKGGFQEKLNRRLPLLVGLLCVIQPVLDVVAYWLLALELSSLYTTALRLVLLTGTLCLGFAVTRRPRLYVVMCLVLLAYLAGHAAACLSTDAGYLNWAEDLTDQARTLVLPITAVSFMSCMKANDKVFPAMLRGMLINLGIILLVQVLSTLTGTDPHTYPTKAAGVRGWFLWPSPQSAILSILCPLVIGWALERWPRRTLPALLISLVSFGMLWFYGTRLGYLTIGGVALGLAVCVFPMGKQRRLQAAGILLAAVLFAALYPLSPMAVNRAAVNENERIKAQRVSAAAAAAEAQTPQESGASASASKPGEKPSQAALNAAYHYNLQGMIDRFGLERVAKKYGDTLDAGIICNDRIMKTRFCSLLMEDMKAQTPLAPLFGVELERTRVKDTEVYDFLLDDWVLGTENYDPEQDAFGVLTLNGWVGFGLLACFLLWFGLQALAALWKDRSRFSPLFAAFLGAYGIALIYAVGTASTLRRNNASVYFAWVLAGLWYLSTRRQDKGETHG